MATLAICETKIKASEQEGYDHEWPGAYVVDAPIGFPTWTDDDAIDVSKSAYDDIMEAMCEAGFDEARKKAFSMQWDSVATSERIDHIIHRIYHAMHGTKTEWDIIREIAYYMQGEDFSVTTIKDDAGKEYTVMYSNETYGEECIKEDMADQLFDRYDVLDVDICDVTDTSIMSLGIKKYNRTVQVNCRKGEDPLEVIKRETGVDVVLYTADGNMRTL